MALNDLTPRLRTRLSHVERWVGLFVTVATLLLLSGFFYYLWHTAERKGWFKTKLPYYTYVDSGVGLKIGDPVKLMGFTVGEITQIEAMAPDHWENVIVKFTVTEPHFGYVWNDSQVRVAAADFLGGRYLEITKGGASDETNQLAATYREEGQGKRRAVTGVWEQKRDGGGRPFFDEPGSYRMWKRGDDGYWLEMNEAPALTERLDAIVQQAEKALPNIFALTNRLQLVLDHSASATSNLNATILDVRPVVANLHTITGNLTEPEGSLGKWVLPPDTKAKLDAALAGLEQTLTSAGRTLDNTDTNLLTTFSNLNLSLVNLANLTSNLHTQVDQNTNLVSGINHAILQADTLMQGLKRHWLLRSAYREPKTNAPVKPKPGTPAEPVYPGKFPGR